MALETISIPLGNKSYISPYFSIGKEVSKNLYNEEAPSDTAKAQQYSVKIPGLRIRWGQTNNSPSRGIITCSNGRVFCVNGRHFFELFEGGNRINLGKLNIDSSTVCNMAENGRQLILVDGNAGYIFDFLTGSFKKILDPNFPGVSSGVAPTHVVSINTYFCINVPNTNKILFSNSYYKYAVDNPDATTDFFEYNPAVTNGYWNPINSANKIGKTDDILGIIDCQNMVWIFGLNSTEIFYDSGDISGQQWQRYSGAIIEIGTQAANSIARYNTNLFWLGNDNKGTIGVFTNEGLNPKRISVRGIEQIIGTLSNQSDCFGTCYSQNGHVFYSLNFIQDNRTFTYDMVTNSWSERSYLSEIDGTESRYRGTFVTDFGGKIVFGDSKGNGYYIADPEYYQNDNPINDGTVNYIKVEKTTKINFNNNKKIAYRSLQLICQEGVGLNNGLESGYNTEDPEVAFAKYPKALIYSSNDTGITWSGGRQLPLGAIGKYSNRTRSLQWGMGRNRVFKVIITEPVQVIIIGLIAEIEVFDS